MWGIISRLWARKSGTNFSSVQMFFHFYIIFQVVQRPIQPHIRWVPGVFSVIEKWLQHKKSDHLPPPGATIKNKCTKLFLPVCAIVTSTRKLHLYLYWLCACKGAQHSSLCNGKTKNLGSFHDPKHCNFVRQIKVGSSEASRFQSNTWMYCIHMYFVLQSPVNRNSHIQSQMHQTIQMCKNKIIRKRMVTRRKKTRWNVNLKTEG